MKLMQIVTIGATLIAAAAIAVTAGHPRQIHGRPAACDGGPCHAPDRA